MAVAREVSKTECQALHHLYGPDKGFNTVGCDELWQVMQNFGSHDRFITLVRQFHDGMLTRVQNDDECSQPFPMTSGVKRILCNDSTLFSMMFSAMLVDSFCDSGIGIALMYQFDGKPLETTSKNMVQIIVIHDFLYPVWNAGECGSVLCNLQNFCLTKSTKKTEVMYQPTPAVHYTEPTITVVGEMLAVVGELTYLGTTLSRTPTINGEVNYRIAHASVAFAKLHPNVWERRGLLCCHHAFLVVYLWDSCHAKQLSSFHIGYLRRLLHINWQDRIPYMEVTQRADMVSIYATLKRSQLRWTGHMFHLINTCQRGCSMVNWKASTHSFGGQKKHYKDTLKASLKCLRGSCQCTCHLLQPDQHWGDCLLIEESQWCHHKCQQQSRASNTFMPNSPRPTK